MKPTPMRITLYDPETAEVKAEYTQMFVPWRLLKVAVSLVKHLNPDDLTPDDVDALSGLVVEVFGNKFSIADLNDGADIGEMMTVIHTIVAKARGDQADPTLPGK